MNNKILLPKKEVLVIFFCVSFLALCLSAMGAGGRYRAKMVLCHLNLKTMANGERMFANDHGISLPYISDSRINGLWMVPLEDYLDKDEVRYCPATMKNPKEPPYTWPNGFGSSKYTWIWPYGVVDGNGNVFDPGVVTSEQAYHGSYAYNWWLYSDRNDIRAWRTANPPNSANVPMFVDCKWVDFITQNGQTCPADLDLNEGGVIQSINAILLNRHRNLSNVAFVDGHVGSVELKQLWSLKWHKEWTIIENMTRDDGSPIYPE